MRNSGGGYSFSQVPTADIPRSTFNRSHGHKTTFDAGYLVPIYVDEALPGDTFKVRASLFARLATPLVPILDNLHLDVFFFAVPLRLVWDNFQKFMGEQLEPGDSTDYLIPQVVAGAGGFGTQSIFDYFGIPPNITGLSVSALFPRAYNLIWNEWFRDENLQSRQLLVKGDGPDPVANYALKKRGKRHDYFTSCLPWPQKGVAAEIPTGGVAPVIPTGDRIPKFISTTITTPTSIQRLTGAQSLQIGGANEAGTNPVKWSSLDSDTKLVADLSQATSVTINQLREAFQIQRLLERDARGGSRYTEILRAHFGVVSPDQRLQRPEYLGGGSVPVTINPVTQTSGSNITGQASPQGHLSGYGVAGASGLGFSKSFVEHTIIIGLINARADLSYQQGVPKMFSRKTRYDFYWPAFAHLGEQAVTMKEIYALGTGADDLVFGYQERWAEYRYAPSKITGKMRSTDATPLDMWHLAQKFVGAPALNTTFIQEDPPIARVIAVTTEPHFLFDSSIQVGCTRPMPTYSVPGQIDRF